MQEVTLIQKTQKGAVGKTFLTKNELFSCNSSSCGLFTNIETAELQVFKLKQTNKQTPQ